MTVIYQNPTLHVHKPGKTMAQSKSYSGYVEPDTKVPKKPAAVIQHVTVNGAVISETVIMAEAQNHPAETPGGALTEAARALVVRELLLQQAAHLNILAAPQPHETGGCETLEDAKIRVLIEQEICTPRATDDECMRFYQRNKNRFNSEALYEARHILFAIEDTGIGIPKESQKIIFERFGQVESSYKKNFQGTGLGLAITKRLVELLGGKIWLESDENKGATFYFTLPNKISPGREENLPEKTQNTLNLKGKFILVVEDDVLNYTVLKSMLDVTGAKHIWIKNGQKAYDYYQEKSNVIDLILLDIQLPEMNGMEFTEKVRINDDIPIVALSAYVLKNEREEILEKGANDFLPKPIKSSLLYEVISKYLK